MMMTRLRDAGKTWLGKIVVGVLFFFLIVSFAIWGIGDVFRGGPRNVIATVGASEITVQAYRDALTLELQQLSRRLRRNVTNDEAIREGIDRQVLARLMSEAALDQKARQLGLAMSDAAMAQAIINDPAFRGASGAFSREFFNEALRQSGFTEAAFVREQRKLYLRQQIAESITGGARPPLALREAFHRLRAERRDIAYVTLDAGKAGAVAPPDEATARAWFDQRKAAWRAPEYRAANLLLLTPDLIARPDAIPAGEVLAEYERVKTQRFGAPERRAIDRLPFPDQASAEAAARRLAEGLAFDALAEEMRIAGADLTLGKFARAEVIDEAIAAAAFALEEGRVSGVVAGRFGPVIVRVSAVTPESVRPLAEVETELRAEMARERARKAVQDVHDKIEDQRASARPLAEIAREFGLSLRVVDGVDAQGRGRDEAPVDLPERAALLRALFQSDVGADTEALPTPDGGYLWFEVVKVDPARDRTFEEARAQVEAAWMTDEIARRLSSLASEWVTKLDAGADLAVLAAEAGLETRTAQGLTRGSTPAGFAPNASALIFGAKVGAAGSAPGADGASRQVYRIIDAFVPPLVGTTQAAEQLDQQLRAAIADDLIVAYVTRLESDLGARVNEAAFRAATRGTTDF